MKKLKENFTPEQLLDNAVDYIYKVVYGQDWICEELLDIQ